MINYITLLKKKENFFTFNICCCYLKACLIKEKDILTAYEVYFEFSNNKIIKSSKLLYLDNTLEPSRELLNNFFNNLFKISRFNNKYKSNKNMFFYVHDFNSLNLLLIIEFAIKNKFVIDIFQKDKCTYRITIINDIGSKIQLRDSFHLFPFSLRNFSSIFGYEKTFFLYFSKTLNEVLQNFIIYIDQIFNLTIVQSLTISNFSLRLFRTKFYDFKNTPIQHLKSLEDQFVRKSFIGGYAEVFKPIMLTNLKPYYHLDVNSLYTAVQKKSYLYPIGYGKWCYDLPANFQLKNFFGFLEVEIEIKTHNYMPFLTLNHKKFGLISPIGSWKSVYFSEELKFAENLGIYSIKYIKGIAFDSGEPFDNFVNTIYDLRINCHLHLKGFYKNILNALYGRFGMKNESCQSKISFDPFLLAKVNMITQIVPIDENSKTFLVNYNTKIETETLKLLSKIYSDKHDLKFRNFLNKSLYEQLNFPTAVQIASAVTAHARILMYKYKSQCDDIYYTDTDSLFTNTRLSYKMISSFDHGKLKIVQKIKYGLFIAPKFYYFEEKATNKCISTVKGLLQFDNSLLCKKDFQKLYWNYNLKIEQYKKSFLKLKNLQANKNLFRLKFEGFLQKRIKIYDKNKNWFNTKPLLIWKYEDNKFF